MSDGKIDFTEMGLDVTQALDRRVARTLLKRDLEAFDEQIARHESLIRTTQAQIDTLATYRVEVLKKLAALGDDDD